MATAIEVRSEQAQRLRVRVRGAVQGVGFRPFVYRLATERQLTGWVRNDGDGVVAEVQGAELDGFLDALRRAAPPLARIEGVEATPVSPRPDEDFRIVSTGGGRVATAVTPDAAVCADCLGELFDPSHRHYRYPFITCTNCGPRYTITHRLPYDRPQTSMADFGLCSDCAAEYGDPLNRRFHAQPIACPACGPTLDMPVERILARVRSGQIVALKGLGGFHLVCDARNESAVSRLRRRKRRGDKPFAVMVANLASARRLATVLPEEASLMNAPARPIVLVEQRGRSLAPAIAPGLDTIGVMLPSTPIHYLLFHEAAGRPAGVAWLDEPQDLVLTMTSANPGGEPLLTDDAEARHRLDGIADVVAGHDRPIVVRCDDSVLRFVGGAPAFVRRARGLRPAADQAGAPGALHPRRRGPPERSPICVTRGDEAFLSQHVGDMDTAETRKFFAETVDAPSRDPRGRAGTGCPRPAPGFPLDPVCAKPRAPCPARSAPPRARCGGHGGARPDGPGARPGAGRVRTWPSRRSLGGRIAPRDRDRRPSALVISRRFGNRAAIWPRDSPGAWRHRRCTGLAAGQR